MQGQAAVRIGSRALDILTALVERPGGLVTKSELMARVWPDVFVVENNLKVNVGALRRTLGDDTGSAKYIATVPGRGYRFIAPVEELSSASPPAVLPLERRHNLPIAATTVFGRDEAIDAIRNDIAKFRMVSIVGAGGVGKTTVALAVAEQMLGTFGDGVWLVDFSALKDPTLVPNAIATAIGLGAPSADALTAVCEKLRDREMLAVFDSCEHLVDHAAVCVDRILAAAPRVKILVTSREPLRTKGERVRRLAGLEAPPATAIVNAEQALAYPAIQLFVDRANESVETFTLTDADAPAAAELCRRLDGLALAIELAASRVPAFGIAGLLEQLGGRLGLLKGRRAGPERHRTLASTLDWSYGLLSTNEAMLLRSVSVFSGVFGFDGASAVAEMDRGNVAEALASLAAKSLVTVDVDADGVAYRLLETTRAYCGEILLASGEDRSVRLRHAEYICAVLERATAEWAARPAQEWTADYGRFLDDLRGALFFLPQSSSDRSLQIRLTVAGLMLWNRFSLTEECRVQVGQAIEELGAANLIGTPFEMHLKVWLGASTMFTHGLQHSAMDAMRRALEIAEDIGDTACRIRCLRTIGLYQHLTGAHAAGLETFETFASLVKATSPDVPEADFHLSISEFFTGRLVAASKRLGRLSEGAKNATRQTILYQSDIYIDIDSARCIVEWLTGSPSAAVGTAKANVARALASNHHMSISNALNAALPVLYWTGEFDECDRGIAVLEEEGQKHGILTRRPIATFHRAAVTCARGDIANGVQALEHVVAEFQAINHLARMPYYLSVLAHTQARCGRIGDARETIERATALAKENSEGWCLPEVQRVHASVFVMDGSKRQAEDLLQQSVSLAHEIGAQSWRLRSATDLARLWSSGSRSEDAIGLLSDVYSEFTEGFETPDLIAAKELLLSLGATGNKPKGRSIAPSATVAAALISSLLRDLECMAI